MEGIPAVLLAFVVLRWLPDGPRDAVWLELEQRRWLMQILADEREDRDRNHGHGVLRALSSGIVWQLGLLVLLSVSFGQYALSLWLPQIVRGFSALSDLEIGFVSAIPGAVTVIAMVLV